MRTFDAIKLIDCIGIKIQCSIRSAVPQKGVEANRPRSGGEARRRPRGVGGGCELHRRAGGAGWDGMGWVVVLVASYFSSADVSMSYVQLSRMGWVVVFVASYFSSTDVSTSPLALPLALALPRALSKLAPSLAGMGCSFCC